MYKGVNRKFYRGWGNGNKDRKIALLSLFQGRGGQQKKWSKNSKKDRKTALFSLYLLYLYHVWKSRGGPRPPAPRYWRICQCILSK